MKRDSTVKQPSRWERPVHAFVRGEHPENWQSEFLQLLSFVVLTTFLIHRHSHESRDSQDEMAKDIRYIRMRVDNQ